MSKFFDMSSLLIIIFIIVLIFCLAIISCRWLMNKEPWETEPLSKNEIQIVQLEITDKIKIERVRFYSKVMNEPRYFICIVPEYGRPINEVFILNHGWRDRPEFLLNKLNLLEVYLKLLNDQKIEQALIVLPDIRFDEYYRKNSENFPFPHYLTLVAEEVFSIIVNQYDIQLSQAKCHVGGFSFGGFVSLDIVRRYSGRFSSASIISAFADPEWSYWPEVPPHPGYLDEQERGIHTVVDPGPIPKLQLACGTNDRFFKQMVSLHEKFDEIAVVHEWLVAPGGHTWKYWRSTLEPMFLFHLGKEK